MSTFRLIHNHSSFFPPWFLLRIFGLYVMYLILKDHCNLEAASWSRHNDQYDFNILFSFNKALLKLIWKTYPSIYLSISPVYEDFWDILWDITKLSKQKLFCLRQNVLFSCGQGKKSKVNYFFLVIWYPLWASFINLLGKLAAFSWAKVKWKSPRKFKSFGTADFFSY